MVTQISDYEMTNDEFENRDHLYEKNKSRQSHNTQVVEPKVNVYVPDLNDSSFDVFKHGNDIGKNFEKFKNVPINISGPDAPKRIYSFHDSGFSKVILKNISRCNYLQTTPCQSYSIPTILSGKDLICCAHTGSGKTAAFLLPLIDILIKNDHLKHSPTHPHRVFPNVLILSPTRELTIQTYHNFKKFSNGTNIIAKMCYGGTTNQFQIQHLKNGCDMLIATIGRLLDLINRKVISLVNCKYLVLDEADRMLDMGFYDEVQKVLLSCEAKDKQIMMYSATFPRELQEIASTFLKKDYIFISIGKIGSVNPDIDQKIIQTDNHSKLQLLVEELKNLGNSKVLIFVKTKKTADFLAAKLSMSNFNATSIHGDRLQSQREQVIVEFFRGIRKILVATDVASRGLDIPKVDYVINYDMPSDMDIYVHRIGRTGRVGNCGKSITFVDTISDRSLLPGLIDILKNSDQKVPDWLQYSNINSGSKHDGSLPLMTHLEDDIRMLDGPGFPNNTMITDNNQDLVVKSSNLVECSSRNYDQDQHEDQLYNQGSRVVNSVCMANDDEDWC